MEENFFFPHSSDTTERDRVEGNYDNSDDNNHDDDDDDDDDDSSSRSHQHREEKERKSRGSAGNSISTQRLCQSLADISDDDDDNDNDDDDDDDDDIHYTTRHGVDSDVPKRDLKTASKNEEPSSQLLQRWRGVVPLNPAPPPPVSSSWMSGKITMTVTVPLSMKMDL